MTITSLPTVPSRADPPATFVANADAFLAALPAFVTELNEFAAALNNLSTTGTSTTSLTIGTGSRSLIVETGKSYQVGMSVKIASTASPTNWMHGDVTAYTSGTGVLVVTVSTTAGSGTLAAWTVTASAPGGATLGSNVFTGAQNQAQGSDIASATTIDLTTATGNYCFVTGTTAITGITLAQGYERTVKFAGALTLTHGASLILPGAANITTAAGDTAIFRGEAAGVVRCISYQRAAVAPYAGKGLVQQVSTIVTATASGTTAIPYDDTIPQNTEGDERMTLSITPTSATNKLIIRVIVQCTNSANVTCTAALFQDSTANALAAACGQVGASSVAGQITLFHSMTAGTTSATTFKVRIGSASGTTYFNGTSSGRLFGGVECSSIEIEEVTP